MSMKNAQEEVWANGKSSKMYEFDYDMNVQADKPSFLGNSANKTRLIDLLSSQFREIGVDMGQTSGDTGYSIAESAIKASLLSKTLCLAADTGILIMLVHGDHQNS